MKIAITGASGRIGRAIHFNLCRQHHVVGVDRSVASVTTHLGEVTDYKHLVKAFSGMDAVIHTAALHAPHVGIFPDDEFYRINVQGTENVVRAARVCGVRTLVFTSTTALYGHASRHPSEAIWIDETTIPEPKTIYHRTKLEAEAILQAEAGPDLRVTTLRMSRCFPEPAPIMAMYRLHRGVDARDVAQGHRLALEPTDESYRIFILSNATPFKLEDRIKLKTNPESVLRERCPEICRLFTERNWELPKSIGRVYDSSLAQSELRWRPMHGFASVVKMLDDQIPEVLPEQALVHQVSE